MSFVGWLKKFLRLHVYNPEWQCSVCGEENFDGGFVCKECEKQLSYNDGYICNHCGRKTTVDEEYCITCKDSLIAIDKARSVFNYEQPVSRLITSFKYSNHRYLAEYFGDKMALLYLKNYFNADFFVYVPMTEKAERKRGYNQSRLLAERISYKTEVPVLDCVAKVKDTKRQAKLGRKDRLKNLEGAFRVTDRKAVKDKTIVIIDDVTTTGATAETIANRLRKAGAKYVYLLTVASTPSYDIKAKKGKKQNHRSKNGII